MARKKTDVMEWALNKHTGRPLTNLLLIKLAYSAKMSDATYVDVSQQELADACDVRQSAIFYAVKELEKNGFIKVKRNSDFGYSNSYRLMLSKK